MNDREAPAHEHAHDHDHHGFSTPDEMDRRVRALETLLTVKGYLDPAALDRIIETCEREIGPHKGARAVARAWVDPAFRDRLLQDATAAIASLGFSGRQCEHMVAVENTPGRHRGHGRRRAGRAGDARRHDRHGSAPFPIGARSQRNRRTPMNGVHDMGGLQNFGPVVPEVDEPPFHAEWEKRALASPWPWAPADSGTST